jgi:hypothetical protein
MHSRGWWAVAQPRRGQTKKGEKKMVLVKDRHGYLRWEDEPLCGTGEYIFWAPGHPEPEPSEEEVARWNLYRAWDLTGDVRFLDQIDEMEI